MDVQTAKHEAQDEAVSTSKPQSEVIVNKNLFVSKLHVIIKNEIEIIKGDIIWCILFKVL